MAFAMSMFCNYVLWLPSIDPQLFYNSYLGFVFPVKSTWNVSAIINIMVLVIDCINYFNKTLKYTHSTFIVEVGKCVCGGIEN